MPRYKKSLGKVTLVTPFNEELQRYLMYELHNVKAWNPETIDGGMTGVRKWAFTARNKEKTKIYWQIFYELGKITVHSDMSRVQIRKGLYIDMGNGRLVIEAHVP